MTDLSSSELRELIRLSQKVLWSDLETRRTLQRSGVSIIPANFYSEIPTVDEFEASFEFHENAPYLSLFPQDVMRDFLHQLDRYAGEFDPPQEGSREAPEGFFWGNPAFSFSDAMSYYCMLRHLRPRRIVEIGSGFSTLVAKAAVAKNAGGEIVCVEPHPLPWLAKLVGIRLIREPVQKLAPEWFNAHLGDGDVLFIDSTHTVKAGSDCLHLYLRVLPALVRETTVHAHDIYLPFPMPKKHFEQHMYWTEQYVLAAYLSENPRGTLLYGSRYHRGFNLDALTRFMRGRWRPGGASLWFRLSAR